MSGECDNCSEHCLECICKKKTEPQQTGTHDGVIKMKTNQHYEIKVWMQIFFTDGSVSQGKRIPAEFLDEGKEDLLYSIISAELASLRRQDGWVLIWGAGNMIFKEYSTFSSEESDS